MRKANAMKDLRLVLAMLIGLGLTLVVGARLAQALTPVTACGQTLNTPGEYVLTGDLACTGAVNGVIITASDVIFHLAGHTISNAMPCGDLTNLESVGIFVQGGVSGVKIDGGTVSGFNDGIFLFASASQVAGMMVTNACVFGIAVAGQNNRLDKNVVTASRLDGVGLGQASGTIITSNDISGNVRAGVGISNFSDNNVVENNIINNNGFGASGDGVAVFNGTKNVVRNNAVNNNLGGISIQSPGNVIQNNTVNGSSSVGISVSTFGAPSTVMKNTVLGSGVTDMSDGSAGCDANTWKNNTFQTDLVVGASDGGPGTGCIR